MLKPQATTNPSCTSTPEGLCNSASFHNISRRGLFGILQHHISHESSFRFTFCGDMREAGPSLKMLVKKIFLHMIKKCLLRCPHGGSGTPFRKFMNIRAGASRSLALDSIEGRLQLRPDTGLWCGVQGLWICVQDWPQALSSIEDLSVQSLGLRNSLRSGRRRFKAEGRTEKSGSFSLLPSKDKARIAGSRV